MDGNPVWRTASEAITTPPAGALLPAGHLPCRTGFTGRGNASRRRCRPSIAAIDAAYDAASRSAEEALRRLADYEARFDRAFARHWRGSAAAKRHVPVPAPTSTATPKGARSMPQSLAIRTTVSTPVAPAQEFAVRAAEDGPAGVADRRNRLAEDAFAAARLACAPSVQPERRSLRL